MYHNEIYLFLMFTTSCINLNEQFQNTLYNLVSYRNSPTPQISFLNFQNCAREKFFLATRCGFIYIDRCVHKITGIAVTEKRTNVCEQRQFDAAWSGGQDRQGRERQPSVVARIIWMTLYIILRNLLNRCLICLSNFRSYIILEIIRWCSFTCFIYI